MSVLTRRVSYLLSVSYRCDSLLNGDVVKPTEQSVTSIEAGCSRPNFTDCAPVAIVTLSVGGVICGVWFEYVHVLLYVVIRYKRLPSGVKVKHTLSLSVLTAVFNHLKGSESLVLRPS